MGTRRFGIIAAVMVVFGTALSAQALADELTQSVQRDLIALGYDPGNIQGEATDQTIAAVAQFQAERDMPVTGEVSPLLAGIIAAEVSKQRSAASARAAPAASAAPAQDAAALQAAQQACLQQKMQEAQAAQGRRRGFGRLVSAVARTAGQTGNSDLARTVGNIYTASATAQDLAAAAQELGLSQDDIASCQNP